MVYDRSTVVSNVRLSDAVARPWILNVGPMVSTLMHRKCYADSERKVEFEIQGLTPGSQVRVYRLRIGLLTQSLRFPVRNCVNEIYIPRGKAKLQRQSQRGSKSR